MLEGWKERLAPLRRFITPLSVISTLSYVFSIIWTIIEFLRGQKDEALLGGFIAFFSSVMISIVALSNYVRTVKISLEKSMSEVKGAALHAIHGIHLQLTGLRFLSRHLKKEAQKCGYRANVCTR